MVDGGYGGLLHESALKGCYVGPMEKKLIVSDNRTMKLGHHPLLRNIMTWRL